MKALIVGILLIGSIASAEESREEWLAEGCGMGEPEMCELLAAEVSLKYSKKTTPTPKPEALAEEACNPPDCYLKGQAPWETGAIEGAASTPNPNAD